MRRSSMRIVWLLATLLCWQLSRRSKVNSGTTSSDSDWETFRLSARPTCELSATKSSKLSTRATVIGFQWPTFQPTWETQATGPVQVKIISCLKTQKGMLVSNKYWTLRICQSKRDQAAFGIYKFRFKAKGNCKG